jgi:hypothetical protein
MSLPARDLLWSVTASTVPSWDYFSEWSRSLTSEVFALSPELKKTLKRITKGKDSVSEKVRAVYRYALTGIRYQQDYESFIAGVKPHRAAAVQARGYGDCKDKSVLIIAMLRQLGIEAHLALVRVRGAGRVLPKVPYQQFNHAVVYLPAQSGVPDGRFLDATAENLDVNALRADVQGTLALVLFPEGHRLIKVPYQEPRRNRFEVSVNLHLRPNGPSSIALDVESVGHLAGRLRKPLQNHQILQQYAQSLVHQLYPECALGDVRVAGHRTILEPLRVHVTASCTDVLQEENGQLRLALPAVFSLTARQARWTERRHPLYLGPPMLARTKLVLHLPDGMQAKIPPQPLDTSGSCLDIDGNWSNSGGSVQYAQQIRRTCAEIPAPRYQRFRKHLTTMKRYLARDLLLDAEQESRR